MKYTVEITYTMTVDAEDEEDAEDIVDAMLKYTLHNTQSGELINPQIVAAEQIDKD